MQAPVEPSLLTSMAHRLRVVKAQLRAQTIDLQSKQHEIDNLKAQLNQAVAPRGWCADHQAAAVRYEKQIADMTSFLSDHGLMWTSTTRPSRGKHDQTESSATESDEVVYFDTILARIQQLNNATIARETAVTVIQDNTHNYVHRFQEKPDAMPLTLFRDGMMLMHGPCNS
ncbi:hypothetical protein H257_11529 [Aphanomyces astaci]|uniref:Uncharacterized protein n=1 Tax=Aphanomyces astaci TaxID=112090 RepID=W4G3K7_APHAT|nr:hypothetical protein H257_11529 [Aphanomyces astaci]ETV73871.1 hypothetical protein H257_11529 [Aphanomyces astaci]|eukprot:XP_009836807.1 hypothetical protein H257_11529 [Aphanomyces astaci]